MSTPPRPPDASRATAAASSLRLARLPGAVWRLGLVSLFTDIASEMATPLIPLLLASIAAQPGLALGLIEGGAQAFLALMSAFSGWHSDRARRRVPHVRAGYAIAVASKALLAVSHSWSTVLGLRLADRFGKGLRGAPRDALLAELSEGRRGAAFGLHRALDTTGALIGCLLAAAFLHFLPGRYASVFAWTAVPGLVAVALTFTLREPQPAGATAATSALAPRAALASLPRAYWSACAALWLFALANVAETFLILAAHQRGLSDVRALLAYAVFNAVYAASSYPAGRLSDRFGRPRVLAAGWILFAVTMALGPRVSPSGLLALFPLLGLHLGLTHGVGKAWVSDRAPRELRATALGVYQLGSGACLLAGGAVVGSLWDRSPARAFAYAAVVAGLAALALAASSIREVRAGRNARP